jgi:putative hemolysin
MSTSATLVHKCGNPLLMTELLHVGLAQNMDDLVECQRLRFLVFNCELGEGLASSSRAGLDRDKFDFICDHLMVRDVATGKLIGTYRMQTGYRAKGNLGYFSEQIFDLTPFEPFRGEILELGRACVHQDFRSMPVIHMLWKGIALYATRCNARYLIGCSSLTSQDQREGLALYEALKEKHLAEPALRTLPHPANRCYADDLPAEPPRAPRLFRAYQDISARLAGPPAIDREFRTIDFLTIVDLQNIPQRVRTRFF